MKSLISRKLAGLAEAVDDLRRSLRVAVATELGKAVATTVREILEVLIARRELPKWEPPRWDQPVGDYGQARTGHDDWDDPYRPSRYDEPDDDEDDGSFATPAAPTDDPKPELSAASLTLAVNTGHWLYRLSRSWLCGLGGSLAVGLAAGYGGPVIRSLLTAAAAVHQLAGVGDSAWSRPD